MSLKSSIIKETLIENQPIPVGIEETKLILYQMENCICKIYQNERTGTGFFCKIPFPDKNNVLNVLITNNHILNKEDIKNNKIIELIMNNKEGKIKREIKMDETRKRFTYKNDEEGVDITIIEIKSNDNINNFLEIDDEILELECKRKSIYVLHYPKDKKLVSYGLINDIIDYKKINHYCNTEEGSSGSPILSLNNYKVIGVHYGGAKNNYIKINYGTYIKYVIKEFENKFKNSLNVIEPPSYNYNREKGEKLDLYLMPKKREIKFNKEKDEKQENREENKNNKYSCKNFLEIKQKEFCKRSLAKALNSFIYHMTSFVINRFRYFFYFFIKQLYFNYKSNIDKKIPVKNQSNKNCYKLLHDFNSLKYKYIKLPQNIIDYKTLAGKSLNNNEIMSVPEETIFGSIKTDNQKFKNIAQAQEKIYIKKHCPINN